MRNRIKGHRKVRAGDLVPHEDNPRSHSEAQKAALQGLLGEIGFARSLLAYELPDGRLKLIDGHLRASTMPDEQVDVEVLDVSDSEAKALLLAIDPLAQLAGYQEDKLAKLTSECAAQGSIKTLWDTLKSEAQKSFGKMKREADKNKVRDRYVIIIECSSEEQQLDLLMRFQGEGLNVAAKLA